MSKKNKPKLPRLFFMVWMAKTNRLLYRDEILIYIQLTMIQLYIIIYTTYTHIPTFTETKMAAFFVSIKYFRKKILWNRKIQGIKKHANNAHKF